MSSFRIKQLLILTITLFLLFLVAVACRPRQDDNAIPVPDPFACLTLPERATSNIELTPDLLKELYPVVPNQLILTGTPADIEAILAFNPDLQGLLEPIVSPEEQLIAFPRPNQDEEPFVAGLYAVVDVPLPEVIQLLYETVIAYNEASGETAVVFAHPNRLIATPWGIDADPWGIDADPWGIDADPWGIDADPSGSDPAEIPGETVKGVWNQWALMEKGGIGLYDKTTAPPTRQVAVHGAGNDVFIFDTSPFAGTSTQSVLERQLCVYHPQLTVKITPTSRSHVQEHGLFVASLVRLVSPNGRLHLIRILNEDGVGDVFSFLVVLNQLMQVKGDMSNSVINLSMSLQYFDAADPASADLGPTPEQQARLQDLLPAEYHPYILDNNIFLPLEGLLAEAHNAGAIIVAASGNSSDTTAGEDVVMGTPAILASSVGVAGNNFDEARSCFSNKPSLESACLLESTSCTPNQGLFAPAGEGRDGVKSCTYPFPWQTPPPECPPSESGGYDCQYALTGVTTSGFAHWLGTSFATPLVSGTAVLMLDAAGSSCTPREITNWLNKVNGVLDVKTAVAFATAGCVP